jgi:hypothetical protein
MLVPLLDSFWKFIPSSTFKYNREEVHSQIQSNWKVQYQYQTTVPKLEIENSSKDLTAAWVEGIPPERIAFLQSIPFPSVAALVKGFDNWPIADARVAATKTFKKNFKIVLEKS